MTTTVTHENIEPDVRYDTDNDSAYSEGMASYTTSITSSAFDFKYENGRRYHKFREGEYPLPNDEKEQDRLDLIHHLHCMILGGRLHLAPLGEDPGRVLDLGTGTGIWAIDFADEYKSATVLGTDLSPIQPRWVPPNLSFEIDDAEAEWPYSKPFKYIHMRTLGGSIRNWPHLLKQAYKHLEPSGWVELQEYETTSKSDDDSFPKPSALLQWVDNLNLAAEKFGKPTNIADQLKGLTVDAGFQNVEETIFKVPMTPWAKDPKLKEMGRYNQLSMFESLEAYTLFLFTNALGWTREEVEVCLVSVRKELRDPSIHNYSTYHFIIGQKPLEAAAT